jgi:hypothetical protein
MINFTAVSLLFHTVPAIFEAFFFNHIAGETFEFHVGIRPCTVWPTVVSKLAIIFNSSDSAKTGTVLAQVLV